MSSDAAFGARAAAELPARERGFSLIEVLAVVLLTVLVIGVTANTYLDLSRATQRAIEGTRQLRHAMAVLDRVSRDLEAAMFVIKPADLDPNKHPWVFLGQSRFSTEGSDQLKFMTRGRALRDTKGELRESDFEVIAYQLVEGEVEGDGLYDLYRWSSPRLPEGLDEEMPPVDEVGFEAADGAGADVERNQLLAQNVERFSLRFLGEDLEWQDSWNASQLVDSSALPIAVEIQVALFDEFATSSVDEFGNALPDGSAAAVSPSYRKLVVLQLKPIDLAARLEPADPDGANGPDGDDEGEDANGEAAKGAAFGPTLPGGGQARERADRTVGDCVVQPLPNNCLSLGDARILGQPFASGSVHVQALIECGARVQPACR